MDKARLEAGLSQLPLYTYEYIDPKTLDFTQRVRQVCRQECPMYGKTWACPPGVGTVEECRERCLGYGECLMIGTVTQVRDISDLAECLSTRADHEAITNQVGDLLREQGVEPYILSSQACALCQRCAYLDGRPCRHPEKMHPCIESHGINLIPTLESVGLEFSYSQDVITWYSLLFFNT